MTSPTLPPSGPRPRPRRLWFFVGGGLLVLSVVAFVVLLGLTVTSASDTDAAALVRPGSPVDVGVPPGEKRMLFVPEGEAAPACSVRDATGRVLTLTPTVVETTVGFDGTTWQGVATFTSTTSQVELDCAASPTSRRLRVGPPLGAGFVSGILLTVLVPLLLGLAGVAVLVWTSVLWFTRGPSAAPAPTAAPPAPWGPPGPR